MKRSKLKDGDRLVHYSIKLTGRVQNVGFRYFAVKKAGEYKIKGTVKNEMDGSVCVEAEGTKEQLEIFLSELKDGPGWARVDNAELSVLPLVNYDGFDVIY